jgi:DNA-binding response OmpR family regulator
MDDMVGLELTRRLRALPRGASLPVLLTSASVISFDPAEARAAGCDDFLPKPFRIADLVQKIGTLLRLSWHEVPVEPVRSADDGTAVSAAVPPELFAQLRALLAQGDLEAFRTALARIRVAHPSAHARWAALDDAAASYQLSLLRTLLDQP